MQRAEALPFLVAAEKVVVLIVDAKATVAGHGAEPGADVASWLVRHGVKVTCSATLLPTLTSGALSFRERRTTLSTLSSWAFTAIRG